MSDPISIFHSDTLFYMDLVGFGTRRGGWWMVEEKERDDWRWRCVEALRRRQSWVSCRTETDRWLMTIASNFLWQLLNASWKVNVDIEGLRVESCLVHPTANFRKLNLFLIKEMPFVCMALYSVAHLCVSLYVWNINGLYFC